MIKNIDFGVYLIDERLMSNIEEIVQCKID